MIDCAEQARRAAPMSKRKRDFLRETLLLMGPERKKSRQNTHEPVEQTTDKDQSSPNTPTAKSSATPATTETPATSNSTDSPKSASRGSWYGGAWRSKAVPLTETAKESVSVAQGVTSEALAEGGKRIPEAARRPGAFVSKSMRGSRKSIPLVAEPTRVHATSDLSDKSRPRTASGEKLRNIEGSTENKLVTKSDPKRTVEVKQPVIEEAPLPPEPAVQPTPSEEAKSVEGTPRPQSWFGWWSRPDDFDCNAQKAADNTKRQDEASSTPLPGTPGTPEDGPDAEPVAPPEVAAVEEATQPGLQPEKSAKTGSSRSWFGLWSSAQNEQAAADEEAHKDGEPQQPPAPDVTISAVPEEAKDDTKADAARKDEDEQPRSSGWAFWSHDRGGKEAAPTPGGTQTQVGELAVADTPSQSHPEAAQFNQQREPEPSKAQPKKSGSLLRPKRAKASGVDLSAEAAATTTPSTPAPSTPVTETPPNTESEVPKPVQRGKAPAQSRPNLILPSFVDNYPPAPNPSYIERVTQYMAETLRLSNSAASSQHVYRSPTKPTIKKAISLGIHGFFPAPLIQKVLGQPTGTSIRFANYGAASIKSWCQDNQPEIGDVEIEKVALEGEGFIADRVNTLWKLMLNWLTHLRQADFILICCHSQGVPVAITLVAKLIQLGCLHPSAKLGVCAMAGINLGPFLDYKSRLFGGSALELFDFCDGSSKVSKSYAESLDVCLRHGVRVTYVGSLDDQLVSLESSLHTPLSHPYVNRAVFIDGRLHAPNFLTHLVIFALKLRNRGISDHGLIRELSAPLAGSLVGGEGHSRVYDDPAVYRLAIDFALESTDATSTPPPSSSSSSDAENAAFARRSSLSGYPSSTAAANHMRRGSASTALPGIGAIIAAYEPPPSAKEANPFYLPWAVRGMLEEKAVKAEMMEEVQVLVKEFEEWKPVSKVLRDVRWRLEGVRSFAMRSYDGHPGAKARL